MTNAPKTPVVVVLGMHRSGTSVGMNVLSALGVALGKDMIPAGRSNLAGFWEHAKIVAVQERLLAKLDRVWHGNHGTFSMPEGWLESDAARDAELALCDILRHEIAAHPGQVWGFKDPRTMRLWPLWKRVWDRLNIEPIPVVMVRHPDAVVRSLAKHNGLSPSRGRLVWLQHNIEAMRHVGEGIRLFVDFDRLVNEPKAEVERIAIALCDVVDIPADGRSKAVACVSTDLRSYKAGLEPPDNPLAARVYNALIAQISGKKYPAEMAETVALYDAACDVFSSWQTERSNVLTDWIVRFLVSRKNG